MAPALGRRGRIVEESRREELKTLSSRQADLVRVLREARRESQPGESARRGQSIRQAGDLHDRERNAIGQNPGPIRRDAVKSLHGGILPAGQSQALLPPCRAAVGCYRLPSTCRDAAFCTAAYPSFQSTCKRSLPFALFALRCVHQRGPLCLISTLPPTTERDTVHPGGQLLALLTSASTARRIASGRFGHAETTRAKSGSICVSRAKVWAKGCGGVAAMAFLCMPLRHFLFQQVSDLTANSRERCVS